MLSTFELILLGAGIVIIIGLSVYAGFLLSALNKQKKQHIEAEKAHQQALHNHDKKVLDSVVIITRAMQAQQCDFSEGCWRLCVLLDSMKTADSQAQQFPAIFQLYDAIKDLSILDARKNLPKQQRMKEDLTRAKAEAAFTDNISAELPLLLQYATTLNDVTIPKH